MFQSLENASGSVLFENDNFMILKINESMARTVEPDVLKTMTTLSTHAPTMNNGKLFPRFPHILFLSKQGYYMDSLLNEQVNEIDEESIVNGDTDLQSLLLSIKTIKGRNESVDINKLFLVGVRNKDNTLNLRVPAIEASAKIDISSNKFSINVTPTLNREVKMLAFINEFEVIYVPIEHSNIDLILDKVKKRSKLDGRISSDYIVYPCSVNGPIFMRQKSLPNMKTDELLSFFGHPKKAGSKVETLSGCLQAISKRHLKNLDEEIGSVGLVEIQTMKTDLAFDVPPIDYVLCRAAHFKTIHAHIKGSKQNIFVRMVKETTDDFAQVLFTTWEQSKRNVQIGFVGPQSLHNVFAKIRNSI